MSSKDQLIRFLFEKSRVRGEIVQLQSAWQAILNRHTYPAVIEKVLGEALAATVLLGATIKFKGSLVLQIHGTGPVNLVVVQLDSDGSVRATAKWQDLSEYNLDSTSLPKLFGDEGKLVITVEAEMTAERYQSIVALGDGGINQAIEGYLLQSEQINTRIWLACDNENASGLLIQEMPSDNPASTDDETWSRLCLLSETVRVNELLDLEMNELLHRLYHEEDLRIFESEPIHFSCSCSRDKIIVVLKSLGQAEVNSILQSEGAVSVDCEYCKLNYQFDAVDIEQIFATETSSLISKTRH